MDRIDIKPTDLISGAMYLKFIRDYKKYDQKQKDIIADLQRRIELQEWVIEDLRLALEESECANTEALRTKLKNQRETLLFTQRKHSELIEKFKELTMK